MKTAMFATAAAFLTMTALLSFQRTPMTATKPWS